MSSQISIIMDSSLKRQLRQKAKQSGITIKSLSITFSKDFVNGKVDMGLHYFPHKEQEVEVLEVTPEIQRDMDQIAKLLEKKRKKPKR